MRPFAILLLLTLIVTACGGGADNDLSKLTQKRDSLMTLNTEIIQELATVKAHIAELDTSTRARVLNVTAMQLKPTRFEHFFKVQGVVEANENAQIFPEAPGRITSIKVKEGQKVSKGQVLMTLDSKVIANQMEEVKSRLALAKIVFKKQDDLWNQQVGSEIQYLEAKNNYESLEYNLETLQSQLAMYTITAPYAGIVDDVMPKTGEMANPAMPVIRLISMNDAYLKADVTEGYLAKIKEGDSVQINFPSMKAKTTSTIERIGSFINPNNRTFKIRINLKDSKVNLKPNMLAELMIRDHKRDNVAVVPSSLIQMTPEGNEFVYVIQMVDGQTKATKVMIKSGMSYKGMTEIIKGLTGNEKLVDKGARSIKEGDVIAVSE